jgi:O-antigen/teichoic acid export membrane protein
VIVIFAREILTIWLGAGFATNSTSVLQWITVGVFVNSLAQIPFAFVQGSGRADITGKLHLLELPLYLAALVLLSHHFGIAGTAIAWSLRTTVDCVCLIWQAQRVIQRSLLKGLWAVVPFLVIVSAIPLSLLEGRLLRAILTIIIVAALSILGWFNALTYEERSSTTNQLANLIDLRRKRGSLA